MRIGKDRPGLFSLSCSTLARSIAHARWRGCLEVASHHENEDDSSKAKLAERATLVKPP
jgi:hypothetical protein